MTDLTTLVASQATALSNEPVIEAIDLGKSYATHDGPRKVLDGISFVVRPGEKLAVLGRNGAGKSTLVRLIAGIETPSHGYIRRSMSLSWPIALSGGFGGSMTGTDCIRFVARIHGRDFYETCDFVENFAELGKYLKMPIKTYSSGMRARLAFGLSLAIDFDCYLIDEVLSVGDKGFQQKSFDELFVRRQERAMIIVSHSTSLIEELCSHALVLKSGRGRVFNDVGYALSIYNTL